MRPENCQIIMYQQHALAHHMVTARSPMCPEVLLSAKLCVAHGGVEVLLKVVLCLFQGTKTQPGVLPCSLSMVFEVRSRACLRLLSVICLALLITLKSCPLDSICLDCRRCRPAWSLSQCACHTTRWAHLLQNAPAIMHHPLHLRVLHFLPTEGTRSSQA